MTIAHKIEIGSDDDDLSVQQIHSLPTVKIDITELTHIDQVDDETGYYDLIRAVYDVYFSDDENVYFVPKNSKTRTQISAAYQQRVKPLSLHDATEMLKNAKLMDDKQEVRFFTEVVRLIKSQHGQQTRTNGIVLAAHNKFGAVHYMKPNNSVDKGFVLLILRDHPTFDEKPYMTIRAYQKDNGEVVFLYGAYDLDEQTAINDFNSR